jgi:hypothetical protein
VVATGATGGGAVVLALWSLKGGAGTTTVAAGLAVLASQRHEAGALLVDLAGDIPAVFGIEEDDGYSVARWLTTDGASDPPGKGWTAPTLIADQRLSVVPRGAGPLRDRRRAETMTHLLTADDREVVIDCGVLAGPEAGSRTAGQVLAGQADRTLLVVRPCSLAFRRLEDPHPPIHGVVLVQGPNRSVPAKSVDDRVGAPVVAIVPNDAAIAWSVEHANLTYQVPSTLTFSLCHLV